MGSTAITCYCKTDGCNESKEKADESTESGKPETTGKPEITGKPETTGNPAVKALKCYQCGDTSAGHGNGSRSLDPIMEPPCKDCICKMYEGLDRVAECSKDLKKPLCYLATGQGKHIYMTILTGTSV